jgi:hypothetical protein
MAEDAFFKYLSEKKGFFSSSFLTGIGASPGWIWFV